MFSGKPTRYAFLALEIFLLAATIALSVLFTSAREWSPAELVALLLALALVGQWLSVEIRGGELGASMVAIVLAMGLLGPVPAAACGAAAMVLTSATRRVDRSAWLANLSSLVAAPFAGGVAMRAMIEWFNGGDTRGFTTSVTFGLCLFSAFVLSLAPTFVLFALEVSTARRRSFWPELRALTPLLPGELAAGALAIILAVAYRGTGMTTLLAAIIVVIIFQRLTMALVRSEDRAEQLLARSRQLVGLQLGVLRTLVRALAMRDERTAHHAAAVAFHARALARALDCSAEEQDMVHTAGLLHDIGKFTWPDRILKADMIDEEDMATVRTHPQEGSILVGALDGYGEIAEAILYHHERIDGRGYPAGLIGAEIPLGSRIVAICSSYDTLVSGSSYRETMSPDEAQAELRNGARNGQLDPELVEAFIDLLQREGPTFGQNTDFDTELDFESRVHRAVDPGRQPSSAGRNQRGVRRWPGARPLNVRP